ncbi:MAG: hypothetical protein IH999_06850 [Proteobacteria bacterium]|nr:hypothetical protein [Pseudomonadota bacterium]
MKEQFPLFPHVDFDMVISEEAWPVGVSARYASQYNRRVAAGALSYVMQLKSVDYTLKRYLGNVFYQEFENDRLDFRISSGVKTLTTSVEDRLKLLGEREGEPIGTVMCDVTLVRLNAAFNAMLTLANRGFLFEAAAVCRMAVVQTAWAAYCFGLEDGDRVKNASASRAITRLKKIYPSIGTFYGWLSNHLHWEYEAQLKVLSLGDKLVKSIIASSKFKVSALIMTLVAVDCYVACFERLYEPRISDFHILGPSDEMFVFKKDRTTRVLLDETINVIGSDRMANEVARYLATGRIS